MEQPPRTSPELSHLSSRYLGQYRAAVQRTLSRQHASSTERSKLDQQLRARVADDTARASVIATDLANRTTKKPLPLGRLGRFFTDLGLAMPIKRDKQARVSLCMSKYETALVAAEPGISREGTMRLEAVVEAIDVEFERRLSSDDYALQAGRAVFGYGAGSADRIREQLSRDAILKRFGPDILVGRYASIARHAAKDGFAGVDYPLGLQPDSGTTEILTTLGLGSSMSELSS